MKRLPDKSTLRDLFDYKNGILIRRVRTAPNAMPGQRAGYLNKINGYRYVCVNGRRFPESRVIYAWHYGDPGDLEVDHINCVRDDNRIENLRLSTHFDNCQNRRRKDAGVSYWPAQDVWRARLKVGCREYSLGIYKTKSEAIAARLDGEKKYRNQHGASA